jgi:hypothetical protein
VSLFAREASPLGARPHIHSTHDGREPHRSGRSPLAAAGLSVALSLAIIWVANRYASKASTGQAPGDEEKQDAGTVGVGDTVLTTPMAPPHTPSGWSPITLDIPAKPFPGQTRPDANGRCPSSKQAPSMAAAGGTSVQPTTTAPRTSTYTRVTVTRPSLTLGSFPPRGPRMLPTAERNEHLRHRTTVARFRLLQTSSRSPVSRYAVPPLPGINPGQM